MSSRLPAAAFSLLLLAACAAAPGLRTARTVGKGSLELGAGLSFYRFADEYEHLGDAPSGELAATYGLGRDVDIGARVFGVGQFTHDRSGIVQSVGGTVLTKWRLVDGLERGVTVSLAPSLTAWHSVYDLWEPSLGGKPEDYDVTVASVDLPLLIGIDLEDGSEWVIGLGATAERWWTEPREYGYYLQDGTLYSAYPRYGPTNFLYVAGSLGFAWKMTERITLLPEVALSKRVYDNWDGGPQLGIDRQDLLESPWRVRTGFGALVKF